MWRPLILAGGAAVLAPPQALGCSLALVLALDVSSSVDAREDRLQRDGLAAALRAQSVREAFRLAGPVAVHAFEWSGRNAQMDLLPGWQMVEGDADLDRIAAAIAASERSHDELPTALGAALGHAASLLRRAPDCARRVVDVSGDGISNEGFSPALAFEHFPFEGVTVNALIIGTEGAYEETARLVAWFRAEVLRGPGAFSIFAESYRDYEAAMETKLLRELALPPLAALEPPAGQ
jgi:hypothetical protein